jgi:hypothetical protein
MSLYFNLSRRSKMFTCSSLVCLFRPRLSSRLITSIGSSSAPRILLLLLLDVEKAASFRRRARSRAGIIRDGSLKLFSKSIWL